MSGKMISLSKTIKRSVPFFVVGATSLVLALWLYDLQFVIAVGLGVFAFFLTGFALKPFKGKARIAQG